MGQLDENTQQSHCSSHDRQQINLAFTNDRCCDCYSPKREIPRSLMLMVISSSRYHLGKRFDSRTKALNQTAYSKTFSSSW
jgi:hypothetical protein